MVRTPSPRQVLVCVVAIAALTPVFGVGGTVASHAGGDGPTLERPGDPEPIVVGDSSQVVSNVTVSPDERDRPSETVTLYLALDPLVDRGVDVDDLSASVEGVDNGTVSNVTHSTAQNHTLLAVDVLRDNPQRPLRVDAVRLDGLDTDDARRSTNLSYDVAVVGDGAGFDAADRWRSTAEFGLLGGSLELRDQATKSTQIGSGDPTEIGVTVSNLSGNVNSTLYLTRGKEIILGSEHLSAKKLGSIQNVSVAVDPLNHNIHAYLVPDTAFGSQSGRNDINASKAAQLALASDRAQVVISMVEFEDLSYDRLRTDTISVSRATMFYLNGKNTPFVVTLHPVDSSGEVMTDRVLGSSTVLTGTTGGVTVHLDAANGSAVRHTTRLAAAVRLAPGASPGERVSADALDPLPNSDLNEGFVAGGVADVGTVSIAETTPPENATASDFDRRTAANESVDGPVYASQRLYFDPGDEGADGAELYRVVGENRSRLVASGTNLTDSTAYGFDTSGLPSGDYYVRSGDAVRSDRFRIVGSGDAGVAVVDSPETVTLGDRTRVRVSPRVPNLTLSLRDGSGETAAAVELDAPSADPVAVTLNTYAAPGGPSAAFAAAGTGADVESVTTGTESATTGNESATVGNGSATTGDGPLSPGTYDLAVRSEHGTATSTDSVALAVAPRSTHGLTAYATDAVDADALGNASAVRAAIRDGTLAPATTVTANDTVVYAANATGLTGLPAAANASLDDGADVDRLDGLAFGVRPTTRSTDGDPAEGDPLGPTPNASAVHLDGDGLFVVAEGVDALATSAAEDGEEFAAAFRVDDDRLRRAADADPGRRVTANLTYVDPAPADERPTGTGGDPADSPGGGDGSAEPTGFGGPGALAGAGGAAGSGGRGSGGSGGGGSGGGGSGGSGGGGGGGGGSGGSGGGGGSSGSGATGGGSDGSLGPGESGGTADAADGDVPGASVGRTDGGPGVGLDVYPAGDSWIPRDGPPAVFPSEVSDGDGGPPGGAAIGPGETSGGGPGSRSTAPGRTGGDPSAVGDDSSDAEAETGTSEPARAVDRPDDADEPDASDGDARYDDAPIRSTAYDLPGFGAVASVGALAASALFLRRRSRRP